MYKNFKNQLRSECTRWHAYNGKKIILPFSNPRRLFQSRHLIRHYTAYLAVVDMLDAKDPYTVGLLLYFVVYMAGFTYLENRDTEIHIIHTVFDDYIPFCEYFIIPYLLWFVFVAAAVIYFAASKERRNEYFQLVLSLCMGMTIFLFISFIYPNGQDLRPELAGDGICIQLVRLLYKIDTPTNILPSLHVFNAAVCCTAILKNQRLKEKRGVTNITIILTVLIILSTVFLKQHSIVDVVLALLMHSMCCRLVYVIPERNLQKRERMCTL